MAHVCIITAGTRLAASLENAAHDTDYEIVEKCPAEYPSCAHAMDLLEGECDAVIHGAWDKLKGLRYTVLVEGVDGIALAKRTPFELDADRAAQAALDLIDELTSARYPRLSPRPKTFRVNDGGENPVDDDRSW